MSYLNMYTREGRLVPGTQKCRDPAFLKTQGAEYKLIWGPEMQIMEASKMRTPESSDLEDANRGQGLTDDAQMALFAAGT